MMKRYLIDVTVSSMYLKNELSDKVKDLSICLLSPIDSKITKDSFASNDSINIVNVLEETGIVQYSINHVLSLVITSSSSNAAEILGAGILAITQQNVDENIECNESSGKCLGYGQITYQNNCEIFGKSERLHIKNSLTTVAVIDYSYTVIEVDMIDMVDEMNAIHQLSSTADAVIDPVEALDIYFDITDLKSSAASVSSTSEIYASLFTALIVSNQNRRTESTIYQEENKKLKQDNKELLRYKTLCEELKSRQRELDLEVAQYRLEQQTNLKRNSQDKSSNNKVEYEKLKNDLIKEKEITNSLKKELASCVSREELFTLQSSSNANKLQLKELESMNDRLIAGLAEIAMKNNQSSTTNDIENEDIKRQDMKQTMTIALLQGCKSRDVILSEANSIAELQYQKDALYRNNQVLSHQVLVLLNQLNITHQSNNPSNNDSVHSESKQMFEDEWNKSYATQYLEKSEVDAGIIHANAGPTIAAQFAIIADLERSLVYCKQVIADQSTKLRHLESRLESVTPVEQLIKKPLRRGSEKAKNQMEEYQSTLKLLNESIVKLTKENEHLLQQVTLLKINVRSMHDDDDGEDDEDDDDNEINDTKAIQAVKVTSIIAENVNLEPNKSTTVEEYVSEINELQTQLDESNRVSAIYYERLAAGSAYMQEQTSKYESQIAELIEQNKQLQQQINENQFQSAARTVAAVGVGAVVGRASTRKIDNDNDDDDDSDDNINARSVKLTEVKASNNDDPLTSDSLDEMDRFALESELEETKKLANSYHEKLAADSAYMQEQTNMYESQIAELIEQNKQLQQQINANQFQSATRTVAAVGIGAVVGKASNYNDDDDDDNSESNNDNDKKIADLEFQLNESKTALSELESELESSNDTAEKYFKRLEEGRIYSIEQKNMYESEILQLKNLIKSLEESNAELNNQLRQTITQSTRSAAVSESSDIHDDDYDSDDEKIINNIKHSTNGMNNTNQITDTFASEEIALLKTKCLEFEEQIEELTDTCNVYHERLKSGGELNKSMSEQLQSEKDEKETLKIKVGNLQDEINKLLIQISLFQTMAEDAETKLNKKTKEYTEQLEESNRKFPETAIFASSIVSSAANNDDVDKLNKKITQLISDLNFERNRCEVLEDDLLKLSFNPPADGREDYTQAGNKGVQNNEELEEELKELKKVSTENMEKLEIRITELNKEIESKSSLINELQEDLKRTEHALDKARAQLKKSESEKTSSSSKHDHDADSILQELIEYKMKVALISADMENEVMNNKHLKQQLESLQRAVKK